MVNLEEQKKHYDELLTHIEKMFEKYKKYKDDPVAFVPYGAITKAELGKADERTAYTQLVNDIGQLYSEAKN
ncbi:MAG: hypothetical protein IH841_05060 [Thaumarchaeota archaeon]|nr:hypothetical protein [Nitrososphaerota archaeon]